MRWLRPLVAAMPVWFDTDDLNAAADAKHGAGTSTRYGIAHALGNNAARLGIVPEPGYGRWRKVLPAVAAVAA